MKELFPCYFFGQQHVSLCNLKEQIRTACDKVFIHKSNLAIHVKIHTWQWGEAFKCSICGKAISHKRCLNRVFPECFGEFSDPKKKNFKRLLDSNPLSPVSLKSCVRDRDYTTVPPRHS